MTVRTKSTLFLSVHAMLSCVLLFFIFTRLADLTNIAHTTLPSEISNLNRTVIIRYLSDRTLYYDEVLTQSARNYAFTQAPHWKERYLIHEKELEATIDKARATGEEKDRRNFEKLAQANTDLVMMEKQSFALAEAGRPEAAQALLDSERYWKLKDSYVESIREYLLSKDIQVENLLGSIEQLVSRHSHNERRLVSEVKISFLVYVLVLSVVTWLFAFFMIRLIINRLSVLKAGALKIENGKFDHVIPMRSGDEFQDLADAFNAMARNLNEMTRKVNREALKRELTNQRNYFSRELHDRLGIMISSLKLQVRKIKPGIEEALEKQQAYNNCLQLVDEAYSQIREISQNPVPETIVKKGLKKSLSKLFARTEMIFSIKTWFITNIRESDFSPQEKSSIYSLIREMLNNTIKHAKCRQITCQIIKHEDHILLMFEDDGVGFELNEQHFRKGRGLKNTVARIEELGGKIHMDSTPGAGATFIVELPLKNASLSHEEN